MQRDLGGRRRGPVSEHSGRQTLLPRPPVLRSTRSAWPATPQRVAAQRAGERSHGRDKGNRRGGSGTSTQHSDGGETNGRDRRPLRPSGTKPHRPKDTQAATRTDEAQGAHTNTENERRELMDEHVKGIVLDKNASSSKRRIAKRKKNRVFMLRLRRIELRSTRWQRAILTIVLETHF